MTPSNVADIAVPDANRKWIMYSSSEFAFILWISIFLGKGDIPRNTAIIEAASEFGKLLRCLLLEPQSITELHENAGLTCKSREALGFVQSFWASKLGGTCAKRASLDLRILHLDDLKILGDKVGMVNHRQGPSCLGVVAGLP